MYCRWFVTCENPAIGMAAHPVFTAVPVCYQCAMKLGLECHLPTCAVCGADVPRPFLENLDYDELLYCSQECWVVGNLLTENDDAAQRLYHRVALQTRY